VNANDTLEPAASSDVVKENTIKKKATIPTESDGSRHEDSPDTGEDIDTEDGSA
jgi:hypothetical protein